MASWAVNPGHRVEQFDKICEVQLDKASVEVLALCQEVSNCVQVCAICAALGRKWSSTLGECHCGPAPSALQRSMLHERTVERC